MITAIGSKTFDRPQEISREQLWGHYQMPVDHDQHPVEAGDGDVHVMSVPSFEFWSVYASGPAMGEPSVGTRNSARWERKRTLPACSPEAFSCLPDGSRSLPKA